MFYGGRLLSNLSIDDSSLDEFISLLPINRRVAILIDSDLGSPTQKLRATKLRVIEEVTGNAGFAWVTKGREVENYVPSDVRLAAVQRTHPSAKEFVGSQNRFGKPLDFIDTRGERVEAGFNKMRIAREAVEIGFNFDEFDLSEKLGALVDFIRSSNR